MAENSTPSDARRQDIFLMASTGLLILLIAGLLITVLRSQLGNYERLLEGSVSANPAISLAYARAFDAAVIKTGSIFLAFLLVLLGGLYTFRATEAAYKLAGDGGSWKGSLETASPGLVMVTLGIVVIGIAITKEHHIDIGGVPVQPPQTEGAPTGEHPLAVQPTLSSSLGLAGQRGGLSQADARALNTALVLIDAHADALSPEEKGAWDSARGYLDALRRMIIFSGSPAIKDNYGVWADRALRDPRSLDELTAEQREQFLRAQQELSETFLEP